MKALCAGPALASLAARANVTARSILHPSCRIVEKLPVLRFAADTLFGSKLCVVGRDFSGWKRDILCLV
jgi:hypothetical protein